MSEITLARRHRIKHYDPLNPPKKKMCSKCRKVRSRKSFARRMTNIDNPDHMCKTCRNEIAKAKRKARDRYRKKYFDF